MTFVVSENYDIISLFLHEIDALVKIYHYDGGKIFGLVYTQTPNFTLNTWCNYIESETSNLRVLGSARHTNSHSYLPSSIDGKRADGKRVSYVCYKQFWMTENDFQTLLKKIEYEEVCE